jgi:hypothetical protein
MSPRNSFMFDKKSYNWIPEGLHQISSMKKVIINISLCLIMYPVMTVPYLRQSGSQEPSSNRVGPGLSWVCLCGKFWWTKCTWVDSSPADPSGLARSNTGNVGSKPTQGIDVCIRLFCVCVVLCVGSSLATGWSPVQGFLLTVCIGSMNWRSGQGPTKGCRAIDR